MIMAALLLPFIGAVAAPLLGRKDRKLREGAMELFSLAVLVLGILMLVETAKGHALSLTLPGLCGMGLHFRLDGFRALYAVIAAFMWLMTSLFSREYFAAHKENGGRYATFTLLTLGGVMGVFYSDDLYTAFVFFEIMSIASYPWVAHEETPGAMRAAATYLGVSIACGMVTLMGMFLTYFEIGTLSFEGIRAHGGEQALIVPACLMLVGYCAKAGLVPLHIWLPKAHPVAPAPASALLSGMLTKTGLFGVIAIGLNIMGENVVFGQVMLVLGLITMLLGAVLGVFSINLKRTLACSSLSQIGYITVGLSCAVILGHHGTLPAAGAVGHMMNHSLLKLLLFMAAGAVYMNAHTLDLTALQGFGRGKPLLHGLFLLGGVGLAGVPLFNGYASKTMIHEGLVEIAAEYNGFSAYRFAEWVFLFAAGLTTAYMLKLYICLFWQKNPDAKVQAHYEAMNKKYLTHRSALALILSAIPVLILGFFPNQTLIPLAASCAPFLNRGAHGPVAFLSSANLIGGGISLIIGTVVYLLVVRPWMYNKVKKAYVNRWPEKLDLEDQVYRPVFCRFLPWLGCTVGSFLDHLVDWLRMDEMAGGRPVAGWVPGIFVGLARIFDELVDHIMLMVRQLFLVSRRELKKVRGRDVFTDLAALIADGAYRLGSFLLPKRWLPQREPTDMRYGSYLTNAISFGLLLCAIGVVGAIFYVFIRAV